MPSPLARRALAALALAAVSLGAAQAATFHVRIDTQVLADAATPPGPFTADLQLIGGSPAGNSATLSNFAFGGGAASGSPVTAGLASGSLAGSVVLGSSPASFFNELMQGFVAGSSLSFDLSLSDAVNAPTPDAFTFAILDATLANIDTSDATGGALLHIDLDGALPSVQVYAGTGAYAGVTVSATAVPEPGALALGLAALAAAGAAAAARGRGARRAA